MNSIYWQEINRRDSINFGAILEHIINFAEIKRISIYMRWCSSAENLFFVNHAQISVKRILFTGKSRYSSVFFALTGLVFFFALEALNRSTSFSCDKRNFKNDLS